MMNNFTKLLEKNVNSKTEKKNGLTYLSWAFAWGEILKEFPEAKYEILKNEKGLPYFADETGAMCFTKVTIKDITHEMWLPVMDGANKTMKNESYVYKTKFGDKTVEAYTMFDINKTVMRCLTKNLAMFGLGLYIYSGEDLPEETTVVPEIKKTVSIDDQISLAIEMIVAKCKEKEVTCDVVELKKKSIDELREIYKNIK